MIQKRLWNKNIFLALGIALIFHQGSLALHAKDKGKKNIFVMALWEQKFEQLAIKVDPSSSNFLTKLKAAVYKKNKKYHRKQQTFFLWDNTINQFTLLTPSKLTANTIEPGDSIFLVKKAAPNPSQKSKIFVKGSILIGGIIFGGAIVGLYLQSTDKADNAKKIILTKNLNSVR